MLWLCSRLRLVRSYSLKLLSSDEVSPSFTQSGIPVSEQSIHYEGRDLNNPKTTMQDYGVRDNSMLLLRRKVTVAGRCVGAFLPPLSILMRFVFLPRTMEHDAEMMRLQLLGDPTTFRRIQEASPSSCGFRRLLNNYRSNRHSPNLQRLQ
jgi:hypothetical protein